VVYSRLVGVFRSDIPFTIVFPIAIRLLKKIPPEKLDAYNSLSKWSCYTTGEGVSGNWIEQGTELLRDATEEQYRVRDAETNTEITRREKTVLRQELADSAMKRYLPRLKQQKESDDDLQKRMEIVKEEAIQEEAVKWKEREERRAKAAAKEKERLLQAKETYGSKKGYIDSEYGLTYWSIVIGGTAIAGAIIAIMKGYHYI
jgi:hypothetical protein